MRSESWVIEAHELAKHYQISAGSRRAGMYPLSFAVAPGEIIGVLGGRAAGKSLLLRLLGGAEQPSAGEIWIDGYDLSSERERALRDVALVPPAHSQTPIEQSVWAYASELANEYAVHDQVRNQLAALGLWASRDRRVADLPIQQRRAVEIVRVLAGTPRLLLLDEPTCAMEPKLAQQIESWLVDYCRHQNAVAIVAVRQVETARRLGDRIMLLNQGQLLAELSPLDLTNLLDNGWYAIQIQGQLDAHWSDWFDGLAVYPAPIGRTTLVGLVTDQAALNGLLNKIYDLGLPLLSVVRAEPDAEQLCSHFIGASA